MPESEYSAPRKSSSFPCTVSFAALASFPTKRAEMKSRNARSGLDGGLVVRIAIRAMMARPEIRTVAGTGLAIIAVKDRN